MMDYDKNQDETKRLVYDLVPAIRSFAATKAMVGQFQEIDSLLDAEIEELYMQWSEKYAFISMLLPERSRISAFVDWATMSPIQKYIQSRKGVKE